MQVKIWKLSKPDNDKAIFDTASKCGPTAAALIRTKCLEAAGGFDELMPARQDWELWIRMLYRYKAEFVEDVLWVYHIHDGVHVFGNMQNRIKAMNRIISKNIVYLEKNTAEYRDCFMELIRLYIVEKDMRNAFSSFVRAVKIEPEKICRSVYRFAVIWLEIRHPKIHSRLKYMVKGEK